MNKYNDTDALWNAREHPHLQEVTDEVLAVSKDALICIPQPVAQHQYAICGATIYFCPFTKDPDDIHAFKVCKNTFLYDMPIKGNFAVLAK